MLAVLGAPNVACAQSLVKIPVTDQTQLPRFSYKLTLAPSALLAADDATFAQFAAQVRADVDSTLAHYAIADKSALRDLISAKLASEMLVHDFAGARASIAELRANETKDDLRLLAGRGFLTYIDTMEGEGGPQTFATRYSNADRTLIENLPWAVVGDSIEQSNAGDRIATRDLVLGSMKQDLDPEFAKTGTLDAPTARQLLSARAFLFAVLPYMAEDSGVLTAYIARNAVNKPEIWTARELDVSAAAAKAPVVIAVWDSGVDAGDYPQAMFVDAAKSHGIAFADDATRSNADLLPLPPDVSQEYAADISYLVGSNDIKNGISSADAQNYLKYAHSLSPDQAQAFFRRLEYLDEYTHGSHVAGIASRGNAAARILNARFNDNFSSLILNVDPVAWTKMMASNLTAMGDYFRANNVRVVNMSWSDDVAEFEEWLTKTDANGDPTARKVKAKMLYGIWRSAIANVIVSTPNALFLAAAGNSDSDASFGGSVPASLIYPNLITVGAVNQAGDSTSFTSYGPSVAIYADGYEVPSKLPGGFVVKYSGTSMATPNVSNLAAKLFAIDPQLTPVQVRALILRGATTSPDGKRKLIDPKNTAALLSKAR